MHKNKLILTIIFLFIVLLFPDSLSPLNSNVKNIHKPQASTSPPDVVTIKEIEFIQERGADKVKTEVTLSLKRDNEDSLTSTIYSLNLRYLYFEEEIWNDIVTGENSFYEKSATEVNTLDIAEVWPNENGWWETTIDTFTIEFDRYLTNTSITAVTLDANNFFEISTFGTSTINIIQDSGSIPLYYTFQPSISIESEYYNLENTRVEIYDQLNDQWIKQTWDTLAIDHWSYKIRVLDLDNNLIYDDPSFVNYTTFRTISIPSLKITNNSPETVNASIFPTTRSLTPVYTTTTEYNLLEETQLGSELAINASFNDNTNFKSQLGTIGSDWEPNHAMVTYTGFTTGADQLGAPSNHIKDSLYSHKNVLYAQDDVSTRAVNTYEWSEGGKTSGEIEFWILITPTRVDDFYMGVKDAAGASGPYISLTGGYWASWSGATGPTSTGVVATENTWFHFRFIFDTTTDKWSCYINKVLKVNNANARNPTGTGAMTKVYFMSGAAGTFDYAVDGLSFSWKTYSTYSNYLHPYSISESLNTTAFTFSSNQTNSLIIGGSITCNISQTITAEIFNYADNEWYEIDTYSCIQSESMDVSFVDNLNAASWLGLTNETTLRFSAINATSNFTLDFYYVLVGCYYAPYTISYLSAYEYADCYWDGYISPFAEQIIALSSAMFNSSTIYIDDLYGNNLDSEYLANATTYSYIPNATRQVIISCFDNAGEYIPWESVQIKLNNTQIYSNAFYWELDQTVEIEIFAQWGDLLTAMNYTVVTQNNYVAITLPICAWLVQNDMIYGTNCSITWGNNVISRVILPGEFETFALPADTYTINWTDDAGVAQTLVVTTVSSYILILNSTIEYAPLYLSFYDSAGYTIDPDELRIEIDGIETARSTQQIVGSTLTIVIYTKYYVLLDSTSQYISPGMNFLLMTLPAFHLIIVSQLQTATPVVLDGAATTVLDQIAPGESIRFLIIDTPYLLMWVDDAGTLQSYAYTPTMMINDVYILETTFSHVYFACFDDSALGVDGNQFRFYLDNIRSNFGFNWVQGVTNIKVLDYFNSTLLNTNINLTAVTEYNLYLPVYTLFINNNYTSSMKLEITRAGITMSQTLPAQTALQFRFLPNVTYDLNLYWMNGTLANTRTVNLTSNNQLISFGFWSTPYLVSDVSLDAISSAEVIAVVIAALAAIAVFIMALQSVKKNYDLKKIRRQTTRDRDSERTYNTNNPIDSIRRR